MKPKQIFKYICVENRNFFCVKHTISLILATLYQVSFCYLLTCIIISSVHGAFMFSINVHVQTLELKNFASILRKFCFEKAFV